MLPNFLQYFKAAFQTIFEKKNYINKWKMKQSSEDFRLSNFHCEISEYSLSAFTSVGYVSLTWAWNMTEYELSLIQFCFAICVRDNRKDMSNMTPLAYFRGGGTRTLIIQTFHFNNNFFVLDWHCVRISSLKIIRFLLVYPCEWKLCGVWAGFFCHSSIETW